MDLLAEGTRIAVLGMGVVFAILILLVGAVRGMSELARRFEPAVSDRTALGPVPGTTADVVAAVTAAIDAHRRRGTR